MTSLVYLQGQDLTIEQVINIAEGRSRVDLKEETRRDILSFRKKVEEQIIKYPEIPIYGVNVGCGDLKDQSLNADSFESYQIRYLRAHNCGTGNPLPERVVRAMMAIRLNSFAKGLSGVQLSTCITLMEMLNKGVTPWVLEEGSVGASGDLIPLSMMAASMIGLDEAKSYYQGKLLSAKEALKRAGLSPAHLGAKEAMALTNGTTFMTAMAIFALDDAWNVFYSASMAAALSLEAIRGETRAFDPLIHDNRPHDGQYIVASHIRELIAGSKRMTPQAQLLRFKNQSVDTVKARVQDRYSFRAVPQIHGPLYEALQSLESVLEIEINSATDNPLLIFDNERIEAYSGANFHGQPIATVVDYVKIALTSLALVSDKRSFSMLSQHLNYGLPKNLAIDPSQGDTGLMIAQYTGASRAAECRILSTPASITSISTSASQEDYVSMGSVGVVHLKKIIDNIYIILSVEFLCAVRALQMTKDKNCLEVPSDLKHEDSDILKTLGQGTQHIFNYLNQEFPLPNSDTYLRTEIEKMRHILNSGFWKQRRKECLHTKF
ncbi:MAG: aromatic amino acid lyase [Planctomycetes bacterium]|jgi:histidine ammonia-lyase|nr:aromatic amino acid lyase [Planctomycetota bacterium]HPY75677.1 aromatic amino acid ammonia-lyase [Planctomycetota bacterium]HQB01226.1 aromatic amino acid ammonia-lyase [Planctomycetota bacterium]HRU51956.1 aromatic amino acid ammonia-lyase [Planctomycetota bacterium]